MLRGYKSRHSDSELLRINFADYALRICTGGAILRIHTS